MTEQQRKELANMQSDAIQRMRDMNSRGQQRQTGDIPPAPDFIRMKSVSKEPQTNKPISSLPEQSSGASKGFNLLKMLNLNSFKMDSDFTVIIAMILLLSSEESDELLLLALLYIML